MDAVTSIGPWPRWRAMLYSAWIRFTAIGLDVATRPPRAGTERAKGEGTPVSRRHVLRILLLHELSKHPERKPPDLRAEAFQYDERSLRHLLQQMGWPARRVRRIAALRWRQSTLAGDALGAVHLAPVPWVVRLGRGSTRAADVARGAFLAMQARTVEEKHLASIRRALEEPLHPRVLVLRERGDGLVVEDGNHFLVATLLRDPDPATRPSLPCLIGARPAGLWAHSAPNVEAATGTAEP